MLATRQEPHEVPFSSPDLHCPLDPQMLVTLGEGCGC